MTLTRFLHAHPEIVLLFTDVGMPDTDGAPREAGPRSRPTLKVLFTTGYTRNAVVHSAAFSDGIEMISKPFTLNELALKVRLVLESGHLQAT